MNNLSNILAKTTTGATIEIIILLLVAGAIAFLIAYFYYKTVYTKKINILESEKAELENNVRLLKRDVDELNDTIRMAGK
jgi:beta-lactamase regulating signal transducer with metallopeptidase domain